jgi:hypothetical protein
MNMAPVAAGFGEREAQRRLAGEKGAAGEAVAVAHGPMALGIVRDVEVIGHRDTSRNEIAHL